MAQRPSMIGSVAEFSRPIGDPDSEESVAVLGKALGLQRLGVNHETLPPGSSSALPHAHSHEEEFVFVVKGCPDVWIDGELHRLQPGDAAAFPAGTGISHCFINNSSEEIQLLIVGENHDEDRLFYPVNPERVHSRPWIDAPRRPLGPHDGKPDPV